MLACHWKILSFNDLSFIYTRRDAFSHIKILTYGILIIMQIINPKIIF